MLGFSMTSGGEVDYRLVTRFANLIKQGYSREDLISMNYLKDADEEASYQLALKEGDEWADVTHESELGIGTISPELQFEIQTGVTLEQGRARKPSSRWVCGTCGSEFDLGISPDDVPSQWWTEEALASFRALNPGFSDVAPPWTCSLCPTRWKYTIPTTEN